MARAKRHHTIPQFHQRRFTHRGSRVLWVFDKRKAAYRQQPPRDTAVISNYYTLPSQHGPSDELERTFAQIEAQAAGAIERLIDKPVGLLSISDDERYAMSNYLGLLYGRVPGVRDPAQHMARFMFDMEFWNRLVDPDGLRAFLRKRGMSERKAKQDADRIIEQFKAREITVEVPETASLVATMVGLQHLPERIFTRRWLVFKRHQYPWFVMGDAPLIVWPGPNHPEWSGTGFDSPGAELSVVIDPTTCLVALQEDGPEAIRAAGTELVLEIGRRNWWRASQYVIGRSQADLGFIEMGMGPNVTETDGVAVPDIRELLSRWSGQ